MADKKPEVKSEGGGSPYMDFLFWILLAFVVFAVLKYFFSFLNIDLSGLPTASSIFSAIFSKLQVLSVFLSLVFFLGIIYFNFKLGEILHHGHGGGHSHSGHDNASGHATQGDHHTHAVSTGSHANHPVEHQSKHNQRWENVLKRISSNQEGDWRLAIIEADIILSDMLSRMGYKGETIAEKLKQVEESDFKTIQSAWNGHKIRNQIAHSGSEYHLTKKEAERAIDYYKEVFEEFYFI
jgi:hypothetical protein